MSETESASETDYISDSSTSSSDSENEHVGNVNKNDIQSYLRSTLKTEPTEEEYKNFLAKNNPDQIYQMLLEDE